MRTKKALYNVSTAAIVQIITLIAGLVLSRFLLITYGSSINGLRASITQFIGYLYIIEMGLSGALTFSLYKPIQNNDTKKINSILKAAQNSYTRIGIIFSLLVIILSIIYPIMVRGQNIEVLTVVFLVISLGATGIINYFLIGGYSVLLNASQRSYIISLSRCIYVIINTSIMIICMGLKLNIAVVYFISLIANLVNVVIIRIYVKKKYKYIDLQIEPDKYALSKRSDVLLHQISGMIVSSAPIFFLTLFGELKEVSVYSVYVMIFSGVSMIISVASSGFTATFGDLIAKNDKENLKEAYSQYEFIYYLMITVVYSCAFILAIPFIKIYTAGILDVNYIDGALVFLFTTTGILSSWKMPQNTIIISAGHFTETRHRAIIEVILTVITCSILGKKLGLKGVLIGSIIGLLYRSIDLRYSKKVTGFSFKITIKRLIRMLVVIFINTLSIYVFIEVNPKNFYLWVINAIYIGLCISIITILINLICEKKTMKNIVNRFTLLLRK